MALMLNWLCSAGASHEIRNGFGPNLQRYHFLAARCIGARPKAEWLLWRYMTLFSKGQL